MKAGQHQFVYSARGSFLGPSCAVFLGVFFTHFLSFTLSSTTILRRALILFKMFRFSPNWKWLKLKRVLPEQAAHRASEGDCCPSMQYVIHLLKTHTQIYIYILYFKGKVRSIHPDSCLLSFFWCCFFTKIMKLHSWNDKKCTLYHSSSLESIFHGLGKDASLQPECCNGAASSLAFVGPFVEAKPLFLRAQEESRKRIRFYFVSHF